MNRRDYDLISKTIRNDLGRIGGAQRRHVAEAFADKLKGHSAGFDRPAFMRACGTPE